MNLIKVAVLALAIAAFWLLNNTADAQIRVNIGGPAVTDSKGNVWAADVTPAGNADGGAAAATVTGTDVPQLFKTARWFPAPAVLSWPVTDGSYTVRVHMADTWPATHKVGARTFSLDVNGQSRGPIDLFASVGASKARVETWSNVRPVSGKIAISLRLGGADNPVLSAIEILPEMDLTRQWRLAWAAPTAMTDGSLISAPLTYRAEYASASAGPFTAAWSGSGTEALITAPAVELWWRVLAVAGDATSDWSVLASAKPPAPPAARPLPPVIVGVKPLALVTGVSGNNRTVYSRTATGTRGPKIGDLLVGPVAQTSPPFTRVRCNPADGFSSGQTKYARVIDQRVSATLREGYVSGCVEFGEQ